MDAESVNVSYKVTDSLEKMFTTERNTRRSKKILMIGEKRMTSDVSSSESRERDIVKFNKMPLLLKTKENKDGNYSTIIKSGNINKDFAKKYAGKLDIGKVIF